MINLVFSTARRLELFKDTLNSFIYHNPNINDLIKKVYILDDRSTDEDRKIIRQLVSSYFPNKTHLITFDNTAPFGYVDKFNFLKNISLEVKYTLYIEDDFRSIYPLNIPHHLEYLESNPEIEQIVLCENFWIQDEDVRQKTSVDEMYWDHSKVELFKHIYDFTIGDNGEMLYIWLLGGPIFTLTPSLNRNTLYNKGTFNPIFDYEGDFSNQVKAKTLVTKNTHFVHSGASNSVRNIKWGN